MYGSGTGKQQTTLSFALLNKYAATYFILFITFIERKDFMTITAEQLRCQDARRKIVQAANSLLLGSYLTEGLNDFKPLSDTNSCFTDSNKHTGFFPIGLKSTEIRFKHFADLEDIIYTQENHFYLSIEIRVHFTALNTAARLEYIYVYNESKLCFETYAAINYYNDNAVEYDF